MELRDKYNKTNLHEFAEYMISIQREVPFKVSARGWAYILEQKRYINKDQFDKVATLINKCRKEGHLPIDFVAEESARQFQGVETPSDVSVVEYFGRCLRGTMRSAEYYDLDWWEGEDYYIQCVVEKVDLVTLFSPVCEKFHIPIANSKGWGSMLQRAEYARRFKEAEDRGMKCVLLYCGDHDPDGLRISEFLRNNLADLGQVVWGDDYGGYDPSNLGITRFGLNFDFIKENNLTWIDNLITGSKKNLADPGHRNHKMPYVQEYLRDIGERKCEANAIVTMPDAARELIEENIEWYLGHDALSRFDNKRIEIREKLDEFLEGTGIKNSMLDIIDQTENHEE